MITHLLDPMHIEGNMCKAILSHIFRDHDSSLTQKKKNQDACREFQVHPYIWMGYEVCVNWF